MLKTEQTLRFGDERKNASPWEGSLLYAACPLNSVLVKSQPFPLLGQIFTKKMLEDKLETKLFVLMLCQKKITHYSKHTRKKNSLRRFFFQKTKCTNLNFGV